MKIKKINRLIKLFITRHRWSTVVIASIILMSLAIVLILSMVFSHKPSFLMPAVSNKDLSVSTQVANRLLSQVMQASTPAAIAELTLTETEVNALIKVAGNTKNITDIFLGRPPDIIKRPWSVTYHDGVFSIIFCTSVKVNTPFGSKINLSADAVPNVDPEHETVKLLQVKAGGLPLPTILTELLARQLLNKQRQNQWYKRIRQVIVSVTVNQNGTLSIKYHPYQLRDFVTELLFHH